ncbi:Kunitz/Bovine pancreatic trypsin inhibitor domain protein [Oesophagostomum dentatum]|uniref:Kunitz/Bovine pancreatic trypsin inhibitor domain protein n=1 Tax=Oesophagostomum dentatum TaxID=61180 RepID=A0A0B1SS97_OESDE|nr:Kunitz/Bovine pancreatic trypsin inhibitor domain protein [Oesophagostomum dentatum]
MWLALILALFPLSSQLYPGDIMEMCKDPMYMGDKNCNETASVRYYLDVKSSECYAFKYTGCGGNRNNFKTKLKCQHSCIYMRHELIAFGRGRKIQSTGRKRLACDSDKKCPEGLTCMKIWKDYEEYYCVTDEDRKKHT